ncbi:DUF3099 domain-containing protein [Microbacterium rhizomatis]|uniref:DUF3099 domain-containing protein n=1 Tax=Microbacterium rhizomatis TaxID=1631477 RepID=A0A5J5J768_9MICO|nr:DUF3099 domain-containing protein [Microbacterium rhizomatis]KAA9110835.1 DUF3099 domain-containing protein [Microbacterium rhizomatis]
MKSQANAQSATSLPRAPRDEASRRYTRYLVMMGIRIVCFVLMVLVTPYGWYTWVFGAGAIFLPYIAVVIANVGDDVHEVDAESPERALPQAPSTPVVREAEASAPPVILIHESRPIDGAGQGDGPASGPGA